ncbi:MAG: Gfo/Idh/MocA family oxidoreductase [Candidatus Sungbacteria bacterium]|nr:Gfo/Idh/MocA family oxidoreductase [Candidatus Sungbacteria bacterium]
MIRFGLVGIGKFGKNYLRLLQDMPGITLVAVAASSEKTLKEIQVADAIKKTTNAEEIFHDSSIDAMIIATPTKIHFTLASSALKQGKHVLLEKPMTATLEEAEALAGIVKDSGKILMIGHQYCYNDHIRLLKQKLDSGFFGKIHYIHAEHFYTFPLTGNTGCFWETATHEFAILDYLFGGFSIEQKFARFEDFFKKGRDDFANVSFAINSKAYSQILENIGIGNASQAMIPVTVLTSWCAPEKIRRFSVVGEKGAAVFDEMRNKEKPLRLYKAEIDGGEYAEVTVKNGVTREPLQNELEHFISCIEEHREPFTDYRHGLRITKHLDTFTQIL